MRSQKRVVSLGDGELHRGFLRTPDALFFRAASRPRRTTSRVASSRSHSPANASSRSSGRRVGNSVRWTLAGLSRRGR